MPPSHGGRAWGWLSARVSPTHANARAATTTASATAHRPALIGRHTEAVSPEGLPFRLHLITENMPLYHADVEGGPFDDPFWGFVWPGSFGLTSFIQATPRVVANARVLDFATGCGVSALAAVACGADAVLANDIDPWALLATRMNAQLNVRTS